MHNAAIFSPEIPIFLPCGERERERERELEDRNFSIDPRFGYADSDDIINRFHYIEQLTCSELPRDLRGGDTLNQTWKFDAVPADGLHVTRWTHP